MILRSLRLREVRRFGPEGIRLDLQPGLNVLSEANEFGKSTVFEAVRTALFYKHSSQHGAVQSLVPWTGGVPHIEIDMQLNGDGDVRLTRRFHRSGGLTELRDAGGAEIARADDAHTLLLARLGADKPGTGPTGLLWVEQGNSIDQPETGPANTALLSDVLSREVGALTGGERSRRYLEAARERLHRLRTPKTNKPTGELRDAQATVDELAEELNAAERRTAETERARLELARVSSELARLHEGECEAGGAEAKLQAARAALAEAERADDRLRIAQKEHEIALSALRDADAALATRVARDARRTELEAEVATLEAVATEGKARIDELTRTRSELQARHADARTASDAAREALARARAGQASAAAREELSHAREALGSAQAAHDALDELALPDAPAIDRAAMDRIEDLEALRRDADARLSGVVTMVEAQGDGLTLDGAALAPGVATPLMGEAMVQVGGVTLHIRPPAPGRARSELDAATAELARELDRAGVVSLERAREAAQLHAEHARMQTTLRERLRAYAPAGLEALAARAAKLDELAARDEDEADPLLLAERSDEADAELADISGQLQAAQEAETQARTRAEVGAERLRRARADLADIAAQHSGAKSVETLEAGANRAREAAAALAEALDARRVAMPNLEAARAEVRRLESARDNRRTRVSALNEARGRLGETLRAASAEAVGERVEQLRGQLERETRRRDALTLRADALTCLVEVLEATQAKLQDRFNAPILRALQPLLAEVIPEAQIRLGSEFRAEGLYRNGIAESVLQLSGGTQGQISALTRLAFADILQSDGRPVPVIFDETFVHSDDQRLEGMFRALNMACARGVQCIVMTCHQGLFEGLGGHRIVPRPWDDH